MSEQWKKLREAIMTLCCDYAIKANISRMDGEWDLDEYMWLSHDRDLYSDVLALMKKIENECGE